MLTITIIKNINNDADYDSDNANLIAFKYYQILQKHQMANCDTPAEKSHKKIKHSE